MTQVTSTPSHSIRERALYVATARIVLTALDQALTDTSRTEAKEHCRSASRAVIRFYDMMGDSLSDSYGLKAGELDNQITDTMFTIRSKFVEVGLR